MSYLTQARLAESDSLMRRITACAALENIPDPETWAWARKWEFSAQPGWVAAFASAEASGDVDPGANEAAITDSMVLSAVQALMIGDQNEVE